MTGELKRHDVDAIYKAAVERSRHRRWAPWPDLRPKGRRRRLSFILSSFVAVLFFGLAVFAAGAGWFGSPSLQSALRSLVTFDRKVASAPGADVTTDIVLAPAPQTSPDTTEVPVLREPVPPAPEPKPPVSGTAPGAANTVPAPSAPETAPAVTEKAPGAGDAIPTPPPDAARPEHPPGRDGNAVAAAPPAPAETPPPDSSDSDRALSPAEAVPPAPEATTAAPRPEESAPSPDDAAPPAPALADVLPDAMEPPDPAAANSVPVARDTPAATGSRTDAAPAQPPPFPLPPRRPVIAATPAPPGPAAAPTRDGAGVPSVAEARPQPAVPRAESGNVFHLGPGPRPLAPAEPVDHAGKVTGPPYVPRPEAVVPLGGRIVSHEAGTASDEPATPSVAAAPPPCPDGAGDACTARPHHWYVGAQLSVTAHGVSTFTAPDTDVKGELEKLGGTNLFAGYRSNFGTRFEAELFYRRHNFSDVTVNNDGGAGIFLGGGDLDGTSGDGQGHLSMTGMMANVFQDFRLIDAVTPFIGGGIGVARVNVSNGGLQSAALVDGDNDVFAYQIGGGVNFALDDRLDMFFEYRYFATDDYDMQYVTGSTVQGKITSHNFGVGLRYGF